LNDEFHSLNNNLIGFPEEQRSQKRITYKQSELAIQNWQLRMEISTEYVALIAQSYAVLRAFSWQLRMSPFPLEALLVALATPQDSNLRDEVRYQKLEASQTFSHSFKPVLTCGLLFDLPCKHKHGATEHECKAPCSQGFQMKFSLMILVGSLNHHRRAASILAAKSIGS
jgi:hypothetical protein